MTSTKHLGKLAQSWRKTSRPPRTCSLAPGSLWWMTFSLACCAVGWSMNIRAMIRRFGAAPVESPAVGRDGCCGDAVAKMAQAMASLIRWRAALFILDGSCANATTITTTVIRSFAAATGSCPSIFTCRAARQPRRHCSTEFFSCNGRSVAKGPLNGDGLALMATGFATHVPKMASDEGVVDAAKAAIGEALLGVKEDVGEIRPTVRRESIVDVLRAAGFRLGTSG